MGLAARRWWLGWVLVALVCAQALGFMHRTVHGWAVPGHALPAQVHAADHRHIELAVAHEAHAGDGAAGHWLADLFSSHGGDSDCRLFDGVGHDGAPLPGAAAPCVIVPGSQALLFLAGEFIARWAALYDARGPPFPR